MDSGQDVDDDPMTTPRISDDAHTLNKILKRDTYDSDEAAKLNNLLKCDPYHTDEAGVLDGILQRDNERRGLDDILQRDDERRQNFIRNLPLERSEKEPTPEDFSTLAHHQHSVEQQLEQQVAFYENALTHLHKRTEEISVENKKLYEKMNKSVAMDDSDLVDDEDVGNTDTADFSLGSEPGQVTGIVNNFISRDESRPKKVTFNVDQPDSPTDQTDADHTNNAQTNNVRTNSHDTWLAELRNGCSNINRVKPTPCDMDVYIDERSIVATIDSDSGTLHEEMRGMKDLYETKSKHVQLLLNTSKKQLEKQQNEITKLKGELRIFRTPVKDGASLDCLCGSRKPVIMSETEKKLVQELLVERDELFEAIKRQQAIVAEGSRHETEAYYQVKKSCELVEQVHLEKQEAVVHGKQLENDMEVYKEKYHTLQKSYQQDIAAVGNKKNLEVEIEIEGLNKKVEKQMINVSVLENQLEKCIREKEELKNELDKFQVHSAAELQKSSVMFEGAQKEVMKALKRQTLAEHETEQIRVDTRLKEKRQQRQADQLAIEVQGLERRLRITEEDLNKSHQNQLALANQLKCCKQELQQTISQQALMSRTFEEKKNIMEKMATRKEMNLTECLHERDKHYELAKDELTRLLDSQTHLVAQYQTECHELNEKLCSEQKQHQLDVNKLTDKCNRIQECVNELLDKDQDKEVLLDNYKQRVQITEDELKQKKETVMTLMSKQNAVLRDRYLLTKEVELLKCQRHTVS